MVLTVLVPFRGHPRPNRTTGLFPDTRDTVFPPLSLHGVLVSGIVSVERHVRGRLVPLCSFAHTYPDPPLHTLDCSWRRHILRVLRTVPLFTRGLACG